MNAVSTSVTPLESYNRYILAGLGKFNLVFGDVSVSEIIVVERSYLLPFPFFTSAMLGVIHHQGAIVPLLSLRRALLEPNSLIPERLTVVRLSDQVESLGGAGLVVDKVISSVSSDQYLDLTNELAKNAANSFDIEYLRLESLMLRLDSNIWEPYRWHPSS